MSSRQHKFAVRGALVGMTFMLLYLSWTIIRIALAYDGTCGGLIPFLSGPRPCSFGEYLGGMLALYFTLVPAYSWALTATAFILGPTLLGVIIDRLRKSPPRGN